MKNIIVLVFIFFSSLAFAESNIRKKNLSIHELKDLGMTGEKVMSMAQDHSGFMWIATNKALHRFDGYTMKVFSPGAQDSNSLPHGDILTLLVDSENYLWIASYHGISRYDIKNQTFEVMLEFQAVRFPYMKIDDQERVWHINDEFAYYYDKNSEQLSKFDLYQAFTESGFPRPKISSYELINGNQFLVTLANKGCALVNIKEKSSSFDIPPKLASICENAAFLEQVHGRLYLLSQDNYFYQYDWQDDSLHLLFELPEDQQLLKVTPGNRDDIWIPTSGALYKSNAQSKEVYQYQNFNQPVEDLTVFVDSRETLWIANRQSDSVDLHNPDTDAFHFYSNYHHLDFLTSRDPISALATLSNERMIIADGNNINIVDMLSKTKYALSKNDATGNTKDINRVHDLVKIDRNTLFLATDIGLFRYSEQVTPQFQKYFPKNDKAAIIAVDSDEHNNLWFSSYSSGLYRLNLISGELVLYEQEIGVSTSLLDNLIVEILVDSKSRVWVASVQGVSRLDRPESGVFRHYQRHKNDESGLCGRVIKQIYEASDGSIWFATDNGLGKYIEDIDGFECFTVQNGLISDGVNSIVEDPNTGNLWLGTTKGVSNLTREGLVLQNYSEKDGLLGISTPRSTSIDKDGVIWMGTTKGVNHFKPSELVKRKKHQNIAITKLQVNNGAIDLQTDVNYLSELVLDYDQNSIQLSFANLEFTDVGAHDYQVKLENWDKQWSQQGNDNQVRYGQLPPGDYELKIALHTEMPDVLPSEFKSMRIKINPPFWLTSWAYLLYVFFSVGTIMFLIRFRTSLLRQRAEQLEKTVQLRTLEIEEQRKTIEGLLVKKDTLFANVSHEFRTPLTLIIGPVTKLINQTKSEQIKHVLAPTLANSKRLLRMVDQLLDLARLGHVEPTKNHASNASIVIEDVLANFEGLFKERTVSLTKNIETEAFVFVPRDALEKIIVNLLSNAIKYSLKDPVIEVCCRREEGSISISVRDQGIGIAEEDQTKIFERFTRISKQPTQAVQGAGIGLALVQELINSYDGSIEVESAIGSGSSFTIEFPIAADSIAHFDEQSLGLNDELDEVDYIRNTDIADSRQSSKLSSNSLAPKILVIEDHPEMRDFVHQSLRGGFDVLLAENGEEGIKIAIEEVPDLIVTDLMMPNKNGFEVAEVVRNDTRTSHIPILMLTARVDIDSRKQAWKSEIDEYFEKPFNADELLIRCENLLNIRRILSKRLAGDLNTIDHNSTDDRSVGVLNQRDQEFLKNLKAIVLENFTDSKLSAKFLCRHLAMSESQLHRKMKALVTLSVPEYIRNTRLRKSTELLKQGTPVTEVAFEVGFSSSTYFSSCFKAYHGISPKEYQKLSN